MTNEDVAPDHYGSRSGLGLAADSEVSGRTYQVGLARIQNLGCASASNVLVRLMPGDGVLAEATVPELPGL